MTKVALSVLALAITPLYGAPVTIDFSTGVGTDLGTLSYAGGTNPLIGTNILIGAVTSVNTPSNAAVTAFITSGLLSFTTGNFVSYDAATQTYTFGPDGTITITGSGPGCLTVGGCDGNAPDTTSGPTLISGVDVSAQYIAGLVNLYITTGSDTSDPTLVQFFGLNPADIASWNFSGSVHATLASGGGGGAFTADSTHSTDISNTPAVPEPASITSLGTFLIGITSLVHRLRVKSSNGAV